MSSFKIAIADVGIDIYIKELALTIKKIVGFKGDFYFNTAKPDETMVKLTDSFQTECSWLEGYDRVERRD